MKKIRTYVSLAGFIFLLMSGASVAGAAPAVLSDAETIANLESLPVQHGGRVKPFKSFAQETVLYITGRTRWEGNDPTALIVSWMANPGEWRTFPVLKVSYEELRTQLGIKVIDGKISVENVLDDSAFGAQANLYQGLRDQNEKLTMLQEKHLELYNRASYMQAFLEIRVPGMIANPESPEGGWYPLSFLDSPDGMKMLAKMYPEDQLRVLSGKWAAFLSALRTGSSADVLRKKSALFVDGIYELFEKSKVILGRDILNKELHYHHVRPFKRAWMLYGSSLLVALLALLFAPKSEKISIPHKILSWTALGLFVGGLLVHTYGMYLRVIIAGRPPVSNMYESMIWVAWVVAALAFIYYLFNRSSFVLNWSALVAAIVLLLAQGFPVVFSPAIDTLVPVLRSNLWLTVHVLTITMSYGAFALAWGLGHGIIFSTAFKAEYSEPNRTHIQYLHRILMIGVVLLAAGTILGGVWANYSWGRYWGWDPKETWALIALLGYVAVLHGRFAGWFGSFGLAAGAVIAFLGVVMAWYGVNYVLAAGLHSYGFGGGGASYVLSIAGLDLLFVLACILKRSKARANLRSK